MDQNLILGAVYTKNIHFTADINDCQDSAIYVYIMSCLNIPIKNTNGLLICFRGDSSHIFQICVPEITVGLFSKIYFRMMWVDRWYQWYEIDAIPSPEPST